MPSKPAIGFPINCGKLVGNTPNWIFNKPRLLTNKFKLVTYQVNRLESPASSSSFVLLDKNVTKFIGSSLITDFLVDIEFLIPNYFTNTTITSGDTNILSNPVNRLCSAVNTGSTYLIAIGEDGSIASVDINVTNVVGTESFVLNSYVSGSLAKHCSDAIDTRIANKNATTTKPIFTTQNHTAKTYVRNSNCWTGNIDLTCASPWNSTGDNRRAGTLISPRHVLFCEHFSFYPRIGATIRFITNNNIVVDRTLINSIGFSGGWPDFRVGLLDSDVPDSIKFAKILPSNYQNYLPSLSPSYTIPILLLDQEEKALVSDLSLSSTVVRCANPTATQRLSFFENIISGDSGNPMFIIINSEAVLLGVLGGAGAGAGPSLHYYKNDINNVMTSLGGGYQLTEISLNGFNTYS